MQASATPLQRAAAEGHVDIVHQLLKHGADVNHQDAVVSLSIHSSIIGSRTAEWSICSIKSTRQLTETDNKVRGARGAAIKWRHTDVYRLKQLVKLLIHMDGRSEMNEKKKRSSWKCILSRWQCRDSHKALV